MSRIARQRNVTRKWWRDSEISEIEECDTSTDGFKVLAAVLIKEPLETESTRNLAGGS